jgi:hypothetical protein
MRPQDLTTAKTVAKFSVVSKTAGGKKSVLATTKTTYRASSSPVDNDGQRSLGMSLPRAESAT